MPSLGIDAVKAALNIVSAVVFAGVAWRYGRWVWRDWRALKTMALGTLPLSVLLLMLVYGTAAGYYGAARVLAPYGYDLRSWHAVINALGVAALLGVGLHMVALWRTDGVPVWPRIFRCTLGILTMWVVCAWALW